MKTPNRIEMEDFKRVLNQEIEVHNSVEHALKQKKDLVIKGDMDELQRVDNELEKLTERIRQLEQERLALMVRMGRDRESLKEFIESLTTGEDAVMLNHARAQLIQATNEIKTLSKTNRDLLTQSIRFIEQSVDFIASILSPEGASYSNVRARKSGIHERENRIDTPSTIIRDA